MASSIMCVARRAVLLLREADVDAAILAPAFFVGALRVELATRRIAELVARDAEAAEERVHRASALGAERHVVLGLTARVGATDEVDGAALERTGGEALRDRLENVLLALRQRVGVVVELRRVIEVLELE